MLKVKCEHCGYKSLGVSILRVSGLQAQLCPSCVAAWYDERDKYILAMYKEFLEGKSPAK